MSVIKNINQDLELFKCKYNISKLFALLTNRGIHALVFYRASHSLYKHRIPFLPLLLTRIIQVVYGIDIDYRAKLEGGIVIVHGVGLVIGAGAVIQKNTIIYHQVTLGI